MSRREYDNRNTGTFGRNERKEKDTHPDVSGSLTIECPHCAEQFDMWLSAWKKERRSDGAPFYSVALKDKEARRDDRRDDRRSDRREPARADDRRDDRRDSRREPARADDRRDDRREPAGAGASRREDFDDDIPF
jgi:hypothetical protein